MTVLINRGFEGDFRPVNSEGELNVAVGWWPWWHATSSRPEFKRACKSSAPVGPERWHTGEAAQQWFSTYARHTAGIYQQVENIQIGAEVFFSAHVMAWVNDIDDYEHSEGKYRMRIGIDPYGGIDPESKDVVWSLTGHSIEPYDRWHHLTVDCKAHADRCTVFVWGQNEWAQKHVNAYVDDCHLSVEGGQEPGDGLTEEQVRELCRDEMMKAVWRMEFERPCAEATTTSTWGNGWYLPDADRSFD